MEKEGDYKVFSDIVFPHEYKVFLEPTATKSHWTKVRGALHAAHGFKSAREEAKSNDKLSVRLERALKNFGLNENAGLEDENYAKECHAIIAGPPRGGKSTLIGVICGNAISKKNMQLTLCKREVSCYVKTDKRKGLPHNVTFWSTVGSDTWTEENIKSYVHDIAQNYSPTFLLFCASPKTFIEKSHLGCLIQACIEEKLLFALICTDMNATVRRNNIVAVFTEILKKYSVNGCSLIPTNVDSTKAYASSITVYNHSETKKPAGLVCKVDSVVPDNSNDGSKKCSGVFELILTLMDILPDARLHEMIYTVLNNRQFWTYVHETFSHEWNEKFLANFRSWYEKNG